jgi:outer membrane protein, heavy metal efflux system
MNNFISYIPILLLVVSLPEQLMAQQKLTLQQLIESVEKNYPSLQQYQYAGEAHRHRADAAKGWMAPVIGTGLMRWPYDLSMTREKNNPMNQASVPFSVEQMIPGPGKRGARSQFALSLQHVEAERREWNLNELKREAKRLYYSQVVAQKQLELVEESRRLMGLIIEMAENRLSANRTGMTQIFKAHARLAELDNMQSMAQENIRESEIGINSLLQRETGLPIAVDTAIKLMRYTQPFNLDEQILQRSDISVMNFGIESMKHEQQVMKLSARPDFGVRAEHMYMLGMPNQWSVMGMVSIPIAPWSAKMWKSEVKAMDNEIASMEMERQHMTLMARRMSAEKWNILQGEYTRYDNFGQRIIPAFESNFSASMIAYRENAGDLFVLLDAWEMLLMKKMEALQAKLKAFMMEAEYEYENEIR